MILQYKGFNNVWIYEEAEIISYSVVYVGDITAQYREDGSAYKDSNAKSEDEYSEFCLKLVSKMHKQVDKKIIEETHFPDEIVYHVDVPFNQLENVTVVSMRGKNKYVTRVFENGGGVYLLNGTGQTVQRLA